MRKIYCFLLFIISNSALGNYYEFIKNDGQWASAIKYKAEIPGGFLLVKYNSLEYFFYDTKALGARHGKSGDKSATIPIRHIYLTFENCTESPALIAKAANTTTYNYILGDNPGNWKSAVRSFNEIVFENLYPNIDFRLFQINGTLKYEYIVKPSGDPSDILLNYEGADNIRVTDTEVLVETSVNVFKEFNPYTYQEVNQKPVAVDAHFVKKNKSVSFFIGSYDNSKTLIIDPELVFSTYSGSSSDNWSHTATYDDDGNLYAGGSVFGPSYFVTEAAFQKKVAGASSGGFLPLLTDIVINKYSSDGSKLLYATFIGGNQSEVPHSLVVNNKGELVIFGTTSSKDFPVSASAFSKKYNGGFTLSGDPITSSIVYANGADVFVMVLSKDGSKLIGSTYVGGSANEGINDTRTLAIRNYGDEYRGEVIVDEQNNIYIASTTNSKDFPVTNSSKLVGSNDAVVFRLTADCSKLEWSTFLGGSDYDAAFSVKVTPQREVFVTGVTKSPGLATEGAFQTQFQGSSAGYVAKFKNDQLIAYTYLTTDKADLGLLLDTDKAGNAYVLGLSTGQYKVSDGVYRNQDSGQFIQSLNNDLTKSNFSTVFGSSRGGGKIDIVPTAFLVNDCGNMYVSGWGGRVNVRTGLNEFSSTEGLPTTRDAFKRTTSGSNYYFMILEAGARSLLYGTFFGSEAPPNASDERGDHLDGGTCRFDKKGVIYHSACVCRGNDFVGFPLKNAVSTTHNSSNCNMAAFKFDIDALIADFSFSDGKTTNAEEFCSPAKLTFGNKSRNAKTYEWFVNGVLISRFENPEYTFKKGGEFKIKLKSYNNTTCLASDSTEKIVNVRNFAAAVSRDTTLCPGVKFNLNAEGGGTYAWSPSSGLSAANVQKPVVTTASSLTYTVVITNGICSATLPVKLTVSNEKDDLSVTPSREICVGDSAILTVRGDFSKFYWQNGNFIDSVNKQIKVAPSNTATYELFAFYSDGCKPQRRTTLLIDRTYEPNIRYDYVYNCNEASKLLFYNDTQNASSVQWNFGNGVMTNEIVPQNIAYQSAGDYVINVTARNARGCLLSKNFPIDYKPWDGKVPNVISPNNDGKNDFFDIGVDGTAVTVFNRWGKIIYKSLDYKNDWGKNIEAGTYLYELTLPNNKTCKGYLDVYN